jgi:hypothetical protein
MKAKMAIIMQRGEKNRCLCCIFFLLPAIPKIPIRAGPAGPETQSRADIGFCGSRRSTRKISPPWRVMLDRGDRGPGLAE